MLVLAVLLVGGVVAYLLSDSGPDASTETIERAADGTETEPREPVVLQGRGAAAAPDAADLESASSEVSSAVSSGGSTFNGKGQIMAATIRFRTPAA